LHTQTLLIVFPQLLHFKSDISSINSLVILAFDYYLDSEKEKMLGKNKKISIADNQNSKIKLFSHPKINSRRRSGAVYFVK
jgi:hypothetical protein